MRLALIQLDTLWHMREANFDRVEALVASLETPPDLICLPEMFATGFTMQVEEVAEPEDGPTFRYLSALARRHRAFVLGSLPQVTGDARKGRNVCLVFDREGALVARTLKTHPFTYGGEAAHYERGTGLSVFTLEAFRAATPICYDLRFPELFRHATARGCELFLLPANWPSARLSHWRSLLVARAIENLAWVVGINRCGEGNGLAYPGHSLVISPYGDIVAEGGEREQVLEVDIQHDLCRDLRARFRFLEDMRRDLFPDLFDAPPPAETQA